MKCKSILGLIFIWTLLFYSCKEVSYPLPQPAGVAALKEVPVALRGKFQPVAVPDDEKKDTLIIESWGYHFKDSNDKDWLGRGVISDSLVIKSYQNYYFINFRSGSQWVLRVIKQRSSGDLELLSIDIAEEVKRKEILKKLSKKMKVTEVMHEGETFYQINPTPTQLIQLIKEGFFSSNVLRKLK